MGDAAGQLLLAFDSEDAIEDARAGILQALEEHREQAEAKKKKRRKRRSTSDLFPAHLPRQEIIVDLDDDEKEGLQRIARRHHRDTALPTSGAACGQEDLSEVRASDEA